VLILAAAKGLPYAFASHFVLRNFNSKRYIEIIFNPEQLKEPYVIVVSM
jgi:hypothetical protein